MVSRRSTSSALQALVESSLSPGQLCAIIEGVEGSLVTCGHVVRVIVSAEALRHHFGATLEPNTWLETFDTNSVVIESAAKHAWAATGQATVVLQQFDAAPSAAPKKPKAR